MNWGKGIVIGMVAFVTFIVTLSCLMFKVPADEYDKQYYEKGLAFDHEYRLERQVTIDHAQPLITQAKGLIYIQFIAPSAGKVNFTSNVGKTNDRVFELRTDSSNMAIIASEKLLTGRYSVAINWASGNHNYLYKQDLYVNR